MTVTVKPQQKIPPGLPATSTQALNIWDAGQQLEVVIIQPTLDQQSIWTQIFDIVRTLNAEHIGLERGRPLQPMTPSFYLSWCFKHGLAVAPYAEARDAKQMKTSDDIRAMAFSIYFDGYAVTIMNSKRTHLRIKKSA